MNRIVLGWALACLASAGTAAAANGSDETLAAAAAPAKAMATPIADRLFQAWDTDHDKALSADEFRTGYTALVQALDAERRLLAQFRAVDTDHSGALDAGEYAGLLLVKRAGAQAPKLARFDADGNGTLGFREYVGLVRALAPAGPEAK
jgi:Ca2+-binding EF-hand superfamily protein